MKTPLQPTETGSKHTKLFSTPIRKFQKVFLTMTDMRPVIKLIKGIN